MAIVRTETVCPFPYTTPPGTNATFLANCTITYAMALGPGFFVLQGILLATAIIGIIVFAYRTFALRRWSVRRKQNVRFHPLFIHFVLCFFFNIFLLLESIDLFGFQGLIPVEAYVIFDGFAAAFGICNGILFAQFLHTMAHGVHDPCHEQSEKVTQGAGILVFVTFVGFAILAILLPDQYRLLEGIKATIAILILLTFGAISTHFAIELEGVLKSTIPQQTDRAKAAHEIEHLRRKHIRFLIVIMLACILLIVDAVYSFAAADYRWIIAFTDLPDPIQVALRVACILNTVACLYLFRVPTRTEASSSSSSGSAAAMHVGRQSIVGNHSVEAFLEKPS